MLHYTILFVSFLVTGSVAHDASFIQPCGKTDSECIVKSAKAALLVIVPGVPSLGLPPLDPMVVNDIAIDNGELKLSFTDLVIHGLGSCTFNKIERYLENSTIYLDIECPIKCVGNYDVIGKLLFVDIIGNGPVLIESEKMHFTASIKLKEHTKSGKKHYKVSGFDYTYRPIAVVNINLGNLFNGDEEKAEPINKLLKESWKDIIMSDNIGKRIVNEILTKPVNTIGLLLQNIPADQLEKE